RYVEAARARYGERGVFFHQAVTENTLHDIPACDLVVATGVLHHLDDSTATQLFRLAFAILKSGGRLVTFDPCLADGQSPVARFLVKIDRGDYIRYHRAYGDLGSTVFPEVRRFTYDSLLRVPYTFCALELRK